MSPLITIPRQTSEDSEGFRSRRPRILQLGHTKTSYTAYTNAQSAQAKFSKPRKCGRARPAGPFSICHASKSGQRTRDLRNRTASKCKRENSRRQGSGGVLDAICQRIICRSRIRAGVRKIWTRRPFLDYHRIHVDRRAGSLEHRGIVRTLVICYAMLDRACHVLIWDLYRLAFAEGTRLL